MVFDETQFNANTNLPTSFSFSSTGDEAYIFSGDGTNLTGYFHGYEFDAAFTGQFLWPLLHEHWRGSLRQASRSHTWGDQFPAWSRPRGH
jgi:hypothetical protein